MKNIWHYLFYVPLLGLIYMYANQGAGVFLGSLEHYNILKNLGYSPEITTWLAWLSAVIDFGGVLLVIFFPSTWTFVAVGLWTWVPRILTALGGGENEILESVAVSVLALLSYIAYTKGYYFRFKKNLQPNVKV